MLRDLQQQVRMMDRACVVEGRVERDTNQGQTVVVALAGVPSGTGRLPRPVDFTLPDQAGGYAFALAPGHYHILAFVDRDGDLELDDGEPARHANAEEPLDCASGQTVKGEPIVIESGDRVESRAGLSASGSRELVEGAMKSAVSLGQMTAVGEVVPLQDPRFDPERARDSLWRPVDFLRAGHAGVYFPKTYDRKRTPVLFIHGINGSPRVLEPLIQHLDGDRFQPMYFYYASGLRIEQNAWQLDRIMREIEHRHGIERLHVVAHSMGGLVARAWLLRRGRSGRAEVGAFVSLSTPWAGYPSARRGVEHSPVVVPVWRDMASGSDFLAGLFEDELPASGEPPHHLLFSFRQTGWMPGASNDGVAGLASMLPAPVQRQAESIFGIDAGHVEILSHPVAQKRVESILLNAQAATVR